jgi:hypothetical protein
MNREFDVIVSIMDSRKIVGSRDLLGRMTRAAVQSPLRLPVFPPCHSDFYSSPFEILLHFQHRGPFLVIHFPSSATYLLPRTGTIDTFRTWILRHKVSLRSL